MKRLLLSFLFCATWLASNSFAQIEYNEHTVTDDFSTPHTIYAIDVNGDIYAVSGSAGAGTVVNWWGNDGNHGFTEHVIDYRFNSAYSV